MHEKLVLIDGNSILNRAYYGLPPMTTSDGVHTNAILGFLNILFKIMDEEKPQYLTVAFDVKHPTFRHEMYDAYKGTRKGMPEELKEQMPLLQELLSAMKVLIMKRPGYEADDILGTLAVRAKKDDLEVSLISGDRDLLQIAADTIKIRIPKTSRQKTEVEDYYPEDVYQKYGLYPEQIIDLKGLMGDASDNIPGVPGVGEKTAVKLLTQYQTVENTLENIDKLPEGKLKNSLTENRELALLSKRLATIKTDCELDFTYDAAKTWDFFTKEAKMLLERLEIKSILKKFPTQQTDQEIVKERETVNRQIVLINDLASSEKVFTEYTDDLAGVVPVYRDDQFDALYLASEEQCFVFAMGGFLTEEYLKQKIYALTERKITIAVFDIKSNESFFREANRKYLFDLQIAAYLLNPNTSSYPYEEIVRQVLGVMLPPDTEGQKTDSADDEYSTFYVNKAAAAYDAAKKQKEALIKEGMAKLFTTLEIPLLFTLSDMERRGIRVNTKALREYGAGLGKQIATVEQEIYGDTGEVFNINSPKQLGIILFEKLKLPYGKKTKTGYQTSAEVLERIRTEDPVIDKILSYRQLTKLKSTYADGLEAYIKEDGRIHSKFNQTITATGRLSSTEPNLQNIPIRMELGRQIRKVFIPKDGYCFVDADYSQIELRILAHMSEDESLIHAFCTNQDIHRMTASQVFHVPFDEVTPAQRSNAKAVNFGIIYGISAFGLGQDLNISRKEADIYIKKYFDTYPKIKSFLDGLVTEAKEKGYVTTLFGRKRPIPELLASQAVIRNFGERIAMNSPIQGTAADIMKIAMLRVNEQLMKQKMKSQLLLQIHDELLIETELSETEEVKKILKTEMMQAAQLLVPLEIEISTGNDWYEAK